MEAYRKLERSFTKLQGDLREAMKREGDLQDQLAKARQTAQADHAALTAAQLRCVCVSVCKPAMPSSHGADPHHTVHRAEESERAVASALQRAQAAEAALEGERATVAQLKLQVDDHAEAASASAREVAAQVSSVTAAAAAEREFKERELGELRSRLQTVERQVRTSVGNLEASTLTSHISPHPTPPQLKGALKREEELSHKLAKAAVSLSAQERIQAEAAGLRADLRLREQVLVSLRPCHALDSHPAH